MPGLALELLRKIFAKADRSSEYHRYIDGSMNPLDLWKEHPISPTISRWHAGPVSVLFYQSDKDILVADSVAAEPGEAGLLKDYDPEDSIKWRRWCFESKPSGLTFHPVMPDRPLLVFTSDLINLPVDARALLYVSIPVVVKAFVSIGGHESLLCTVPSQKLSNSWFGTVMEGELCYALKSFAQREVNELEWSDHTAICPVEIINRSNSPFQIERLCIRPSFFNIYASSMRLWTNRVSFTYRGDSEMSKIDYLQSPPPELTNPVKIIEAAEAVPHGIVRRTFSNLVSSIT